MALRRKTPFRSTYTPLPRTKIKPRSDKKKATDAEYETARENVLARDRYTCRLRTATGVVCAGPLHVHHIKYRGRRGTHDEANLTVVCTAHHEWVHSHDEDAHRIGLALHAWEEYGQAWVRMHALGLAFAAEPSRVPDPRLNRATEDDRCEFHDRRGFIGHCPACIAETALR